MRRALAIPKYVPAVLCGLLLVAWVVSCFKTAELRVPTTRGKVTLILQSGCILYLYTDKRGDILVTDFGMEYSTEFFFGGHSLYFERDFLGKLHWDMPNNDYYQQAFIPIPFLITLALPLAIGGFIDLRFPLWSYFAWTALVAAELAYYLR